MNPKNALGFFVLGTLMYVAPELAASVTVAPESLVVTDGSVRAEWLGFMSWVIGGIGGFYLLREGFVRLPVLAASMLPERLLQPATEKSESMPAGAQVGVSN